MNASLQHVTTLLEWKEPVALEPRFELHSGEEVLATLSFQPLCRTLATATTLEGTWTFEQTGILSSRVYVLEAATGQEIAVFSPGFMGRGLLRFDNGVAFAWRREPHQGGWSFRGWRRRTPDHPEGRTGALQRALAASDPGRGPHPPSWPFQSQDSVAGGTGLVPDPAPPVGPLVDSEAPSGQIDAEQVDHITRRHF